MSVISMVGYDPRSKRDLDEFKAAVAGAFSGMVTRFVCQPLDVLKIRFQLQIEPITKFSVNSKYTGIRQCLKTMRMEEEIFSLWKGHVPAQLLSVVYGAVQFSTFETLTRHFSKEYPRAVTGEDKPYVHFICGGMSGAAATVVSMPLDVVRTRLVGQGEPKTYKTMRVAMRTMLAQEGVTSYFKGLSPALLLSAPYVGLQFGLYSYITTLRKRMEEKKAYFPIDFSESLTSGMMAGVAAKTIVYPLDVVKKRLQVQGFEEARKQFGRVIRYKGFFHCMYWMVREEGIMSFYKGFLPSSVKAMVATGCSFAVYEQTIQVLIPDPKDPF